MSLYQWLCVLGIPGMLAGLVSFIGYPKLVGELSTKIRTKACFRGNRISGRKGFNNRTENMYPDQ